MRNGIEDDQNAKLAASKFVEAIYIYIHIRWSLLEGKVTVRIKLNVSVTA